MTKLQPKNLFLTKASLFLVIVIDIMGFGIVFPELGPIFLDKTHSILPSGAPMIERDILYGLAFVAYFLSTFLGAPFFGDLSDHWGRKKTLIICVLGTGVGFIISGMALDFELVPVFLIGRAISGFCAGSQPIAQAAIVDLSDSHDKTRNLAFITLAACTGFAIGPVAGGFFSNMNVISWFTFATPFYAAAILTLVNVLGLKLTMEETFEASSGEKKVKLSKAFKLIKSAFDHPEVWKLSLTFYAYQIGWSIFFEDIPLQLEQVFHYTTQQVGLFMGYLAIVFGFSLMVAIRFVLKVVSVQTMVMGSLVVDGVFIAVAGQVMVEWQEWLVATILCMTNVMAYTGFLTLFSDSTDENHQGWIMGVSTSLIALAWASGAIISSLLTSTNLMWPFYFGSLFTLIALGLMFKFKLHASSDG